MKNQSKLTRRRLNERFESWGIFYDDVRVGGLSEIHGTEGRMIWQWSCGFYPGCTPRQQGAGNEDTFEDARVAFRAAWQMLQAQITPAMIDEWRKHQAFMTWKYAMWDSDCRMPTQTTTGKSQVIDEECQPETLAISPNTAASRYRYALEQLAHELRRVKEDRRHAN